MWSDMFQETFSFLTFHQNFPLFFKIENIYLLTYVLLLSISKQILIFKSNLFVFHLISYVFQSLSLEFLHLKKSCYQTYVGGYKFKCDFTNIHLRFYSYQWLCFARLRRAPLHSTTNPWRHLAPKKCAHGQSQDKCERSLPTVTFFDWSSGLGGDSSRYPTTDPRCKYQFR